MTLTAAKRLSQANDSSRDTHPTGNTQSRIGVFPISVRIVHASYRITQSAFKLYIFCFGR